MEKKEDAPTEDKVVEEAKAEIVQSTPEPTKVLSEAKKAQFKKCQEGLQRYRQMKKQAQIDQKQEDSQQKEIKEKKEEEKSKDSTENVIKEILSTKRKRKKIIIQEEASSSSSDSEPEIQIIRKKRTTKAHKKRIYKTPAPSSESESEPEDSQDSIPPIRISSSSSNPSQIPRTRFDPIPILNFTPYRII